jgi:hypothetical protein
MIVLLILSWLTINLTFAQELNIQDLKSLTTNSNNNIFKDESHEKLGFVFIAFIEHCPILRKNYSEFEKIRNRFSRFDFYYVGRADASSTKEIIDYKINIPLINDSKYDFLKKLNLKISGQSSIYLKKGATLTKVYTGAINDQHSFDHSKKTKINHYVIDTLSEIEAKKEVKFFETPAHGCMLNLVE